MSNQTDEDNWLLLRGQLITERIDGGFTQVDVAFGASTGQAAVSEWETGAVVPSMKNFLAWARTLGFDVKLIPTVGDGVF